MLNVSQYSVDTFLPALNTLLADKTAKLLVPAQALLAELTDKQIKAYAEVKFPNKPSRGKYLAELLAIGFAPGATGLKVLAAGLAFVSERTLYARKRNPVQKLLTSFNIERPVISLTDKEKGLLRGTAALLVDRVIESDVWCRHYAMLAWADGSGLLVPDSNISMHDRMAETRDYLSGLFRFALPKHDTFLAGAAASIATHQHTSSPIATTIRAALSDGARWMEKADLTSSPFYSTKDSPASLLIGYAEGDVPVFFPGNESLITVGGPGSGKSAGQVIPNLLRYPGSAIVLDVKGELWEQTAGYRAKRYGKVYRFAPNDPQGRTHRYNPFDFISSQPDQAAVDCGVFSYQVVLENPKLHDPYWESKGRDFIWAFAMALALNAPSQHRNIEGLAELVNLPLINKPKQPIVRVIQGLKLLAKHTRIPDLESAANALEGGLEGRTLENVIDTARRYLAPFARSGLSRTAMSFTDWKPQDLRTKPGTTLYICVPPEELTTYGPLIRLVLYQHARILQNHTARPGEPPITFFLDEMPKLGNFDSILQMQDLGRSAGLRLWMFAQSVGQLSNAFGHDRYKGVIDACRVRMFMQPDAEAAGMITNALGSSRNIFSGENKPLAETYELMGLPYHDKTVITARGDLPMSLTQKRAYLHMPNRILTPPIVQRAMPPP